MAIDKKNEWSFISNAQASLEQKTAEIIEHIKCKYPYVQQTVPGSTIKFDVSGVTVYTTCYSQQRSGSTHRRVTLRMSINRKAIGKTNIREDFNTTREVKETYAYSDGSSRIDLGSLLEQIKNIVDDECVSVANRKRTEFNEQLFQMKMVGKFQVLVNTNLYKVVANAYSRTAVNIVKKESDECIAVIQYDPNNADKWVININRSNWLIQDSEVDEFMKAANEVLKYACSL